MEIELWRFLPPQHLLGVSQLLPGLLHVESRVSSPLNNRCPETDRFACVVSAHRVVSSDFVKCRGRNWSTVDDLQSLNIIYPPQAVDRQHCMRPGHHCLAWLLLSLLLGDPNARARARN